MYKLFMKKKENLFAIFAKKDLVYQEPYKNIQCCITNNFEIFFTEMPSYIFYLDEMIYLYNFSSKCNLKVHMENVHEGLKRFECEKCSQKFTERFDPSANSLILTYCCINCLHVLPDLEFLESKFKGENSIVFMGCHSAKFVNEKGPDKVRDAILKYDIKHPVINDDKMIVWK